ncbi:MAG TPA: hypothetical protein VG479_06140 [Gaiellaceae bacterium]|jgi:hypothetical protein|nr:hypothetical protein [Gaiellaceae bacterium]
MWRLALLALTPALAVTLVPTASAADIAARTPGAQGFELKNGHGRAVISRRGTVFVNLGRGRIRVIDLPGGKAPHRECNTEGRRVGDSAMEYRGRDVRCNVSSLGAARPWRVVIRGRKIFAAGVVRGSLTLDAFDKGRRGRFQIGDGPLRRWPRAAHTYRLLAQ